MTNSPLTAEKTRDTEISNELMVELECELPNSFDHPPVPRQVSLSFLVFKRNGQGQAHDKCYPLSPTHFLSSVRFHYGSQFVLVWLQEAKGTWFGVVNDKGSGGTSISTWPHSPWGQSSCLFSQIRFWALSRFTAGQNCDIILSPNSA